MISNTPIHIAIIPDANRRWAKKRGLKPWEGHEAGAKNLEVILRVAKEQGIKHLSFWGSSEDNLKKRPIQEKRALLDIYQRYFKRMLGSSEVHKNKIKINVFGEWEKQFPFLLKRVIRQAIEKTKQYKCFFVNFFLAYSGTKEMTNAIKRIASDLKKNNIKNISRNTIKNYLFTKDLPPVDLLIRTGSVEDPHLSDGFLMWETQNSQLFFSPKPWPDFNKQEFLKAINSFKIRERRFGG